MSVGTCVGTEDVTHGGNQLPGASGLSKLNRTM